MRGKRNHFRNYIVIGILLLTGFLCSKTMAFAGEINGNEAGVIAAASGTFSYGGKTYQAGSEYIGSLTSSLTSDDVDLTSEQASEVIHRMYASVAEGIARGYLYEVGRESGNSEAVSPDQKDKETTEPEEKETPASDQIEKDGKADESIWAAVEHETEAKSKLAKRPGRKDAAASVWLEKDEIIVATKDNEKIFISKSEELFSGRFRFAVEVVAGVVFAIGLSCGFLLFITKCMSFRKPKSRRVRPGHSRRRRLRRHIRNILTVVTTISLVAVLILLGSYISLFNKNAIMQNMQNSGYFRYAYSEYISDMKEDGKSEEPAAYETYLFNVKQNSQKILEGETDVTISDSNIAPYLYNMKNSYWKLFRVTGVFMILSLLTSMVLLLFMDQKRRRGIKHIAAAVLIASASIALLTAVMAIWKPYLHLYIEPDYLYLFLMESIQWSVKVMTSITALSVVLGMILTGVCKTAANHNSVR